MLSPPAIQYAAIVCLLLVTCLQQTIGAKPSGSGQPIKSEDSVSEDYADLQRVLAERLPGSTEENMRIIDLLVRLLEEIDLPTLCDVIANDTSFVKSTNQRKEFSPGVSTDKAISADPYGRSDDSREHSERSSTRPINIQMPGTSFASIPFKGTSRAAIRRRVIIPRRFPRRFNNDGSVQFPRHRIRPFSRVRPENLKEIPEPLSTIKGVAIGAPIPMINSVARGGMRHDDNKGENQMISSVGAGPFAANGYFYRLVNLGRPRSQPYTRPVILGERNSIGHKSNKDFLEKSKDESDSVKSYRHDNGEEMNGQKIRQNLVSSFSKPKGRLVRKIIYRKRKGDKRGKLGPIRYKLGRIPIPSYKGEASDQDSNMVLKKNDDVSPTQTVTDDFYRASRGSNQDNNENRGPSFQMRNYVKPFPNTADDYDSSIWTKKMASPKHIDANNKESVTNSQLEYRESNNSLDLDKTMESDISSRMTSTTSLSSSSTIPANDYGTDTTMATNIESIFTKEAEDITQTTNSLSAASQTPTIPSEIRQNKGDLDSNSLVKTRPSKILNDNDKNRGDDNGDGTNYADDIEKNMMVDDNIENMIELYGFEIKDALKHKTSKITDGDFPESRFTVSPSLISPEEEQYYYIDDKRLGSTQTGFNLDNSSGEMNDSAIKRDSSFTNAAVNRTSTNRNIDNGISKEIYNRSNDNDNDDNDDNDEYNIHRIIDTSEETLTSFIREDNDVNNQTVDYKSVDLPSPMNISTANTTQSESFQAKTHQQDKNMNETEPRDSSATDESVGIISIKSTILGPNNENANLIAESRLRFTDHTSSEDSDLTILDDNHTPAIQTNPPRVLTKLTTQMNTTTPPIVKNNSKNTTDISTETKTSKEEDFVRKKDKIPDVHSQAVELIAYPTIAQENHNIRKEEQLQGEQSDAMNIEENADSDEDDADSDESKTMGSVPVHGGERNTTAFMNNDVTPSNPQGIAETAKPLTSDYVMDKYTTRNDAMPQAFANETADNFLLSSASGLINTVQSADKNDSNNVSKNENKYNIAKTKYLEKMKNGANENAIIAKKSSYNQNEGDGLDSRDLKISPYMARMNGIELDGENKTENDTQHYSASWVEQNEMKTTSATSATPNKDDEKTLRVLYKDTEKADEFSSNRKETLSTITTTSSSQTNGESVTQYKEDLATTNKGGNELDEPTTTQSYSEMTSLQNFNLSEDVKSDEIIRNATAYTLSHQSPSNTERFFIKQISPVNESSSVPSQNATDQTSDESENEKLPLSLTTIAPHHAYSSTQGGDSLSSTKTNESIYSSTINTDEDNTHHSFDDVTTTHQTSTHEPISAISDLMTSVVSVFTLIDKASQNSTHNNISSGQVNKTNLSMVSLDKNRSTTMPANNGLVIKDEEISVISNIVHLPELKDGFESLVNEHGVPQNIGSESTTQREPEAVSTPGRTIDDKDINKQPNIDHQNTEQETTELGGNNSSQQGLNNDQETPNGEDNSASFRSVEKTSTAGLEFTSSESGSQTQNNQDTISLGNDYTTPFISITDDLLFPSSTQGSIDFTNQGFEHQSNDGYDNVGDGQVFPSITAESTTNQRLSFGNHGNDFYDHTRHTNPINPEMTTGKNPDETDNSKIDIPRDEESEEAMQSTTTSTTRDDIDDVNERFTNWNALRNINVEKDNVKEASLDQLSRLHGVKYPHKPRISVYHKWDSPDSDQYDAGNDRPHQNGKSPGEHDFDKHKQPHQESRPNYWKAYNIAVNQNQNDQLGKPHKPYSATNDDVDDNPGSGSLHYNNLWGYQSLAGRPSFSSYLHPDYYRHIVDNPYADAMDRKHEEVWGDRFSQGFYGRVQDKSHNSQYPGNAMRERGANHHSQYPGNSMRERGANQYQTLPSDLRSSERLNHGNNDDQSERDDDDNNDDMEKPNLPGGNLDYISRDRIKSPQVVISKTKPGKDFSEENLRQMMWNLDRNSPQNFEPSTNQVEHNELQGHNSVLSNEVLKRFNDILPRHEPTTIDDVDNDVNGNSDVNDDDVDDVNEDNTKDAPKWPVRLAGRHLGLWHIRGMTGQLGVPAPNDYTCPGMFGYHRDSNDCQAFFICSWGVPYRLHCPPGTRFNSDQSVCDWAVNVPCPIGERE